jgi:hypothetical protein
MGNSILETKLIAKESLVRLRPMEVMRQLVYSDYSDTFQKQGDTIRIKKPAVYTADEFSTTISTQDIIEDSVDVKLEHIADVSVIVSSQEMTLNIDDFNEQIITPAMEAIAQKVDADIHKDFYKGIPYFSGTSGTTPNALPDFASAKLALTNRKVPLSNRVAVWNPDADSAFSVLDAIVNAEKSGSTAALRDASIGKIQLMNNYMSQNVQTHTAGLFTALTDVTITTGALGAESIVLTSAAGTSTAKLLEGDLFTLDGNQYVVTADTAAASSGVVTAAIYPALPLAYGDMDAVTVAFADVTAGAHVVNLAFAPKACAFVSRPLAPPMDGSGYTTSFEGLSLRVVMSYNISTKVNTLSIDTLYGVKTIFPKLAHVTLG